MRLALLATYIYALTAGLKSAQPCTIERRNIKKDAEGHPILGAAIVATEDVIDSKLLCMQADMHALKSRRSQSIHAHSLQWYQKQLQRVTDFSPHWYMTRNVLYLQVAVYAVASLEFRTLHFYSSIVIAEVPFISHGLEWIATSTTVGEILVSLSDSLPNVFPLLFTLSMDQIQWILVVGMLIAAPFELMLQLRIEEDASKAAALLLDAFRVLIELPLLFTLMTHLLSFSFIRSHFFPATPAAYYTTWSDTVWLPLRFLRYWIGIPLFVRMMHVIDRRTPSLSSVLESTLIGMVVVALALEPVGCVVFHLVFRRSSYILTYWKMMWNFLSEPPSAMERADVISLPSGALRGDRTLRLSSSSCWQRFSYVYNMHCLMYERYKELYNGEIRENILSLLSTCRRKAIEAPLPSICEVLPTHFGDTVSTVLFVVSSCANVIFSLTASIELLCGVFYYGHPLTPAALLRGVYLTCLGAFAAKTLPWLLLAVCAESITPTIAGLTPSAGYDPPNYYYWSGSARRGEDEPDGVNWMTHTVWDNDSDIRLPSEKPRKKSQNVALNLCRLIETYYMAPSGDRLATVLGETAGSPLLPHDVVVRVGDFFPPPYTATGLQL